MEDLIFEPYRFVTSLEYLGFGLLGIFVVIGLIVGVTCLLNFLTKPTPPKDGKS